VLDQYFIKKYSLGSPVTSSIKTAVATLNHQIKQLKLQYLSDNNGMFESVVKNLIIHGAYFGNGLYLLSNRFTVDIYHKEIKEDFLDFLSNKKYDYNPVFGFFILSTFKPILAGYKIGKNLWLQGIGGENQFYYKSLHLGMLRKELINELETKFKVAKNSIYNPLKKLTIIDKNGSLVINSGASEFIGNLNTLKENLPVNVLKQTELLEELDALLFSVYRGYNLRNEIISVLKNDLSKS